MGRKIDQLRSLMSGQSEKVGTKAGSAPESLVDLALETWRFRQTAERCLLGMNPLDAERFSNGFEWYLRTVQVVLNEAGLSVVDLTGKPYDQGMAVTPLNLEDFYMEADLPLTVAQMVEPIIIENGSVRRVGSVLLREEGI